MPRLDEDDRLVFNPPQTAGNHCSEPEARENPERRGLPTSLHRPERERVLVLDEQARAGNDGIRVRLAADFVAGELFESRVVRVNDDQLCALREGEHRRTRVNNRAVAATTATTATSAAATARCWSRIICFTRCWASSSRN